MEESDFEGTLVLERVADKCAEVRAERRGNNESARGVDDEALWVDDEKTTAEFTAKHALTFPLGHSADARAIAEKRGWAAINQQIAHLMAEALQATSK